MLSVACVCRTMLWQSTHAKWGKLLRKRKRAGWDAKSLHICGNNNTKGEYLPFEFSNSNTLDILNKRSIPIFVNSKSYWYESDKTSLFSRSVNKLYWYIFPWYGALLLIFEYLIDQGCPITVYVNASIIIFKFHIIFFSFNTIIKRPI